LGHTQWGLHAERGGSRIHVSGRIASMFNAGLTRSAAPYAGAVSGVNLNAPLIKRGSCPPIRLPANPASVLSPKLALNNAVRSRSPEFSIINGEELTLNISLPTPCKMTATRSTAGWMPNAMTVTATTVPNVPHSIALRRPMRSESSPIGTAATSATALGRAESSPKKPLGYPRARM
jgi:hypothetical protein